MLGPCAASDSQRAVGWLVPSNAFEQRSCRRAKLATGAVAIVGMVALATLGGLYLIPAVIAWLVVVATERSTEATKDQAPQPRYP